MKSRILIAMAVTAGILAAVAVAGCSVIRSGTSTAGSHSAPGISATPSNPATPNAAAAPPTTMEQLCDTQTWPRPLPDVVGRVLYQVTREGALGCWDNLRGVAPDGHDPIKNPNYPGEKTYRITALTPPPGTLVGRYDLVTVQLAEVDSTAPPASRPCDWVTSSEAAAILGWPVSTKPYGDESGSVDMGCFYDQPSDMGVGVQSDLRVPGAFPVDAASQFAIATTSNNTTNIDGLGVKAVCVVEPRTTPPSTTLLVLLNGDRLFRVTEGYASCDTLKQFAQTAIGRIGA
jgi:hypothetical protein